MAIDLLSPVPRQGPAVADTLLAIRAGGSKAVLNRYERELTGAASARAADSEFWQQMREFTPEFMRRNPSGVVLRVSTTLERCFEGLAHGIRAGHFARGIGVTYVYLSSLASRFRLSGKQRGEHGWSAVVEFASDEIRQGKDLWLQPASTAGRMPLT